MPTESQMPRGCPDFEPYANGKNYRWTRGEDFKISPDTIRRYAYQWAAANGYRTKAQVQGDSVFIRFTKRVQDD
jgi:hypothetical protein